MGRRTWLSLWRGIQTTPPSMADILAEVAEKHRLTVADLKGQSRVRSVAWARQEAMWLMRKEGRWSLPQIGRAIGNRNHATILFGVRRYGERLAA